MMYAVNLGPELKIRKIDDAEVTNLAEFWHFTKKATYSYLPLEQFGTFDEDEKFFREKILPRCDVWAADDNGRITGFLARKGVGRSLMSASLANVREHGFDAITLWVLESNTPARAFYESIGFALDGTLKTVHPRGDFSIREVRYRLDLK